MAHFKSIGESTGSVFEIIYENCSLETITSAIDQSFMANGYSVKTGNLGDRTYMKGNRVARILLGAFYKYFEFNVAVKQLNDTMIMATVRKTTSGMSGGIIGVNQVKKELRRLQDAFQAI